MLVDLPIDRQVSLAWGYAGSSRRHYEDNGDNEAVKGESLSEDHHKNESDQDISLSVTTDTSITDDTDAKSGGERGESTAQASAELLVTIKVGVLPSGGVIAGRLGVDSLGDY